MNGIIYAIESETENKIYIGGTEKKTLKKRLNNHNYDYRHYTAKDKPEQNIRYCASYEILKDLHTTYEIKKIVVKDRQELREEEKKTIQEYKNNGFNVVNINMPILTPEEKAQCYRDKAKRRREKMTPEELKEYFNNIQTKYKKKEYKELTPEQKKEQNKKRYARAKKAKEQKLKNEIN